MKEKEAVEVITLDLKEIKPHPKNPKSHWDAGIENSISERGYIELIVVDEKNQLIAGEGRWRALQKLGYEKVKVIRKSGLTEKQKIEYLLASNKLTERGGWNKDLLKQFEKDTLLLGGFESEEIEAIFDLGIQEDEFDEDKEYGKISEATAKRGDVYLLGNHKLMCGDSTQMADVEKLMVGEKADMCWTDPPYNVDYNYAKYEAIHRGRKQKFSNGGKIFNDKKKPEDFYQFLLAVFKNIFLFTKPEVV